MNTISDKEEAKAVVDRKKLFNWQVMTHYARENYKVIQQIF